MADTNPNHNTQQENTHQQSICPFLGLEDDPDTWLSFANGANHCHKFTPARPVDLRHQRRSCLTQAYPRCKIYTQGTHAPLTSITSIEPRQENQTNQRLGMLLAGLIVISLLITGAFWLHANWGGLSQRFLSAPSSENVLAPAEVAQASTETPQSTPSLVLAELQTSEPSATLPPSATPTIPPTKTATLSPTLSPTPRLTATPTGPTPGPALNTPFGPQNSFLLHRVVIGESLGNLAWSYHTTAEVIQAANVLIEGASIWPDTVLVIYPNVKDPGQVTRFLVVCLETPTLPEDIAAEYLADLQALLEFNQINARVMIPAGRWLVIPVPET